MEIHERLRQFIDDTGLKHYVFAEKCGYSARALSMFLTGKRLILPKDILIFCKTLDITPNDLFGFDEDNKTK